MTEEEIIKEMGDCESKYQKLRKLAFKTASEMDKVVERYHKLENELANLKKV